MKDLLLDDELTNKENPDDIGPRCSCRNASNAYHVRSDECKEIGKCDAKCKKKRQDQKRPPAPVRNACYGLPEGLIQSTPRAELQAILVAVQEGISPQRIISDHINHVNYMDR